jgi:hypothetical protein
VTDSSDEVPRSRNDESDMIEAANKFADLVATRRPSGNHFTISADHYLYLALVETGGIDGYRGSTPDSFDSFQAPFGKDFAERSQMATENGFLRVWQTANEFKSQRGCGVAATDVAGIAYNYYNQVIDEVVRFADRLGGDVTSTGSGRASTKGIDESKVS